MKNSPDWWEINIDAVTGAELSRFNYTNYDSYRVFAQPLENPDDGVGLPGSHPVVNNPANALASPFGWHDTNGQTGAEFTDTRGNNVNAQEDANNNNTGGARPAGGAGNNYNVAFDPASLPADVRAQLDANFGADKMAELSSNLKMNPNDTFTLSLGGIKPGKYAFFCTPHLAMNMKGEIVVQ